MWRFRNKKPSVLDESIASVLEDMKQYTPTSPEYPNLLEYLERLNALKSKEKRQRITSDTMALVIGNLAGIAIIVAYEHAHVAASRGLNFVLKPSRTVI
jgi:hypothetical protein